MPRPRHKPKRITPSGVPILDSRPLPRKRPQKTSLATELSAFAKQRLQSNCKSCALPKPLLDVVNGARGNQGSVVVSAFLRTKGFTIRDSAIRRHWTAHLDA